MLVIAGTVLAASTRLARRVVQHYYDMDIEKAPNVKRHCVVYPSSTLVGVVAITTAQALRGLRKRMRPIVYVCISEEFNRASTNQITSFTRDKRSQNDGE